MKNLIVLLGPTAVGKTEISLELAEQLRTSIISADSRQLYADLKIGTAAPTPEQLARVHHYFVGTLQLSDYYSAAQYADEVLTLLNHLFLEQDVVLLTGGSMMYIDAVCQGIDDIPTVDADTRTMMWQRYEEVGLEGLQRELKMLDPEYYAIVDLKNYKRIIHALEICYMTGKTFTSFRQRKQVNRPFNIIKIGLNRERSELFNRINLRVEEMMQQGMLNEARRVYPLRDLNSLNTVGYKELFKYFDGDWTLEEAVEKIKRNTRVYAKKQLTWFKKDTSIHWFHPDQRTDIFSYIQSRDIVIGGKTI
ncbi:MAG: tRNA (adenosine(37)-N6)-dimethylallyltransferase MiaA [Bacteroidaceae bacterium]|nr:tRNA (adenosine(37)-N6)-dimethylallyltransferase MiaA [Bacteroidaceae bacterium]